MTYVFLPRLEKVLERRAVIKTSQQRIKPLVNQGVLQLGKLPKTKFASSSSALTRADSLIDASSPASSRAE